MPKRSQKYPCRVSEGEQKRYCQVKYDGYTKKPSKVEPVWLKDNYGVLKGAVKVNKQEIEQAIENMHSHIKAYEDNLRSISTVNSINKNWDGKAALGQPISIDDKRYIYTVESLEACKLAITALEHQLTNGWIPVSSGNLPKNEERVFICADRKYSDGKVTQIRAVAMYEDGTVHTEDSGFNWEDSDFDYEYDEGASDYIIPEGWWEQNMYSEEFKAVDDFVTHWMPMPESPEKETL